MDNYLSQIIEELSINAQQINLTEIKELTSAIRSANHIFLKGAGRSGLVVQAFANRLLHLGFQVSVVGEISSPRSQKGDLLIICSSSGETTSLVSLAKKANQQGVKIALITNNQKSSIGELASAIIHLGTDSKNQKDTFGFTQAMGTAFEQLAFILFDSIVLKLMDQLQESSQSMAQRHADLE